MATSNLIIPWCGTDATTDVDNNYRNTPFEAGEAIYAKQVNAALRQSSLVSSAVAKVLLPALGTTDPATITIDSPLQTLTAALSGTILGAGIAVNGNTLTAASKTLIIPTIGTSGNKVSNIYANNINATQIYTDGIGSSSNKVDDIWVENLHADSLSFSNIECTSIDASGSISGTSLIIRNSASIKTTLSIKDSNNNTKIQLNGANGTIACISESLYNPDHTSLVPGGLYCFHVYSSAMGLTSTYIYFLMYLPSFNYLNVIYSPSFVAWTQGAGSSYVEEENLIIKFEPNNQYNPSYYTATVGMLSGNTFVQKSDYEISYSPINLIKM